MKKMTDSENKYEQRVRQRAEEIALLVFPRELRKLQRKYTRHPRIADWTESVQESCRRLDEKHWHERFVERCLPAARLTVQREAEAYSQGYAIGRDMEKDPYSRAGLKTMLQSLGLMPENAPDTCANLASQLKKAMPETYPGKAYQPLFDHMSKEHNLTLLESEMQDIIEIVRKMDSPWISVEDRLPERGQIVDIYCMGEDKYCTARITRSDVKDFVTWSKATHWRPQTPLPAHPESLTDKP